MNNMLPPPPLMVQLKTFKQTELVREKRLIEQGSEVIRSCGLKTDSSCAKSDNSVVPTGFKQFDK
ncbi:MAG TPA: hypothetical protein V6C86_00415 [Oculatellaceae cyanobacterium]